MIVLIAALFFPDNYAEQSSHIKSVKLSNHSNWPDWIKSLGVSLIAVSFTYGGYQQTINFGNEVEQPLKIFQREFLLALALSLFLYLLVI